MLKVPCITMRENTEWIETVEDGWNVLVGVNRERILRMVNEFEPDGKQRNVFGNGNTSEEIVRIISGCRSAPFAKSGLVKDRGNGCRSRRVLCERRNCNI